MWGVACVLACVACLEPRDNGANQVTGEDDGHEAPKPEGQPSGEGKECRAGLEPTHKVQPDMGDHRAI